MSLDPRRILEFLHTEAGRPLKPRELAAALSVPPERYGEFRELLTALEADGVIIRVQRQRYAAPARVDLVAGRVQTTRGGAGFLVPEEAGPDIFIPVEGLGTAVDGDRVVVRVERRRGDGGPRGRVTHVLERARSTVVGVFHRVRPGRGGRRSLHGYVVPEDRKLPWDIFVAPSAAAPEEGDLVVVRIADWGTGQRGPTGAVVEVLGPRSGPGVDILAIIRGHGLPTEFPAAVEAAAEALRAAGITEADFIGREDLRSLLVFTIDPADAKDHDDALSVEALADGWRVGIHIADVAHYVEEGGALDLEAARRGTSVYLVDRVVPMLPHALSSDLCSLHHDMDRLALSLLVELSADGSVRGHRLVRSVIRSRHRLSYEDAQAVLDGGGVISPDTDAALRHLAALARELRRRREDRGSLDFDLPETRVVLDVHGEPTDIQRLVRLEAHRLVEDFMLLANELIARQAARLEVPFIHRVHEAPDAGRMAQLRAFTATIGFPLRGGDVPSGSDLQVLLRSAAGRPEEALLSSIVLRSMKQARYSEQNVGHYGLAIPTYTHFTSPIRRYPDLLVHRICAGVLIDGREPWLGQDRLAHEARHASERERIAVAAERDSRELKKVEYMQRHEGDEFDGTIAGVTAFGFFVLLSDVFVEGLVHVSSLDDDFYVFREDEYALVGERTRRRFRPGDQVRVQVARVDIEQRRIEFGLVSPAPADVTERRRG